MEPEIQTSAVQTNIASEQRNAARDYCEIHEQRDLKFVLATWSTEKLDATAIENLRFFKARFGFEACTVARIQVVAFQKQFDLSDFEIHDLQSTGFLRAARSGLHVETGNLLHIMGWIQIALFAIMNWQMLATVATSNAPEWKQSLGFLGVGFIATTSLAWVFKSCISPRRLLNACGALDHFSNAKRAKIRPA